MTLEQLTAVTTPPPLPWRQDVDWWKRTVIVAADGSVICQIHATNPPSTQQKIVDLILAAVNTYPGAPEAK